MPAEPGGARGVDMCDGKTWPSPSGNLPLSSTAPAVPSTVLVSVDTFLLKT